MAAQPKRRAKPGVGPKTVPTKVPPALEPTASAPAARPERVSAGHLYYGDNLEILKEIGNASVDLIYLDPPFKSNQDYNVLFRERSGLESAAQVHAFEDTWTWNEVADATFQECIAEGGDVADTLLALKTILRNTDMMAYLAMMAPRLVELRRVLHETGSIYLHCDPTASHYLKILMDSVFGAANFQNEIIWKRTSGHSDATRYGRVHDVIFFYSASPERHWNATYQPYDQSYVEQYYRYTDERGRRFMSGDLSASGLQGGGYEYIWKGIKRVWRCPKERMEAYDAEGRLYYTRNGFPRIKRYLDEAKGMPVQDVWTDIQALRSWHTEKIGYPTQKPVALLERILEASSQESDVVLDPFCGCGTTIEAALKLNRRWIGIDIAYVAIDVIETRLVQSFGEGVEHSYICDGKPRDVSGARRLFEEDPFDFEVWAVRQVDGFPSKRQRGDRGVDGKLRFSVREPGKIGTSIISVKGGEQINPGMVRDLIGTVKSECAEMGLLILMKKPTPGMVKAAHAAGTYEWSVNGRRFPKVQILTVDEILRGKQPRMPAPMGPMHKARAARQKQMEIFPSEEDA